MKPFFLGTIFLYVLLLWFVGGVASRRSRGSDAVSVKMDRMCERIS
jgi:hypothetical protein